MVMFVLSPTYRQLWLASVEKPIDTADPGRGGATVFTDTNVSLTKPHFPASPEGLAQGLPRFGSRALKTCTRLLPRSHTYSRPSLLIFTQCTGFRKNAGFTLPLV